MFVRNLLSKRGAAVLLATALLAGCGGAKTGGPSQPLQAPPADAAHTVKHAMGQSTVPAEPKRVVVLDTGELDIALALGVKPVGAVIAGAESQFPEYLKDRTDGIVKVGTVSQPNLEAIAALQPDLILSSKVRHEKIYDQLSAIAPTVFAETTGYTWKENVALYAEALGKSAEAAQAMAQYDQRLKEFRETMGDRLADTTVSLIRSMPDHVRIYKVGSFSGTILRDAGLPRPAGHDEEVTHQKVTEEAIPSMDADVIFVMSYGREQGESLSGFFNHPLWKQLGAVQNDRVIEVDDGIWGLGIGPIAANLVIDDLYKYLANAK